ncbi:MAG TPA: thermonuclease family protein [Candidatus Deferrimicrobiaceae bacterium]
MSPSGLLCRNLFPGNRLRLLPVFLLFLSLLVSSAGAETGIVEEVVDGDTLVVRDAGEIATVRLIGIDSPERSHPSLGKEFLADESAAFLSSLCLGKFVRMEADAEETDKYERRLRYVFLPDPDGRLLNLEMLRAGMARAYTRFAFSRRDEFVAAEAAARREGNGLWKDGGMAEARWLAGSRTPRVEVYPSGGRSYIVAYGGMAKPGVERGNLPKEIEAILRLRAELSDAEFGRKARERGYRPVDASKDAPGPLPRPAGSSSAAGDAVVPWEKAHLHAGKEIVVEGTIVRTHRAAKVLYLNFHPNWKRYLTIVIRAGDIPRFPEDPAAAYKGKKIRARGEVQLFKDRPEMILRSPEDITIVP